MSYAIDANVLLFASDTGSPLHETAQGFLARCAGESEPLCIAWSTLMAYLRIATHPRIFDAPLSPADAAGNVEALLRLPQVRVLSEGEEFWEHYRDVTARVVARGNLVPDAHLVALLRSHDVRRLYTHDRDFLKFDGLDVRDPFDGGF